MLILTDTNFPRAIVSVVLWPSFVRKGSQYLMTADITVGSIVILLPSLSEVMPDKVSRVSFLAS
jgi:hypothetical protein